jgi:hypothetical protein
MLAALVAWPSEELHVTSTNNVERNHFDGLASRPSNAYWFGVGPSIAA